MSRTGGSHRGVVSLWLVLGVVACERDEVRVCEVADPVAAVVQVAVEDVVAAERWGAVELWTAGGLEEEGAELMMPTSARVRTDGTLAIADFASGDVWLVDPDGRWLEPVAGRGQGPGELLNPLATAWTTEGRLLALDASQSKVERYDIASGGSETLSMPSDLLAPVFASGQVGWFGMRGDGTVFVELPSSASSAGSVTYVRGAPGDEARSVIWEAEYPEGMLPAYDRPARPEWPRALLAVGGDRWAVAPRSDRYEVIVYGSDDEAEVHVCVSDQDVFGTAAADDSSFDQVHGVAGAHLDVLSPDGQLLGRLELPHDLRFQDARGDTLWAFRVGEFEEVEVVAARITRSSR